MVTRPKASWPVVVIPAVLGAILAFGSATFLADGALFTNVTGSEFSWESAMRGLASPPPRGGAIAPPAPLYPHLLKALQLEKSPAGARAAQMILLGFLIPFCASLAALRWKGRGAARAAGFLALGAGSLWVHAAWFVPAAWQALSALLVLTPLAGSKPAGPAASFGAGIACGVAGLFGALWAVPAALIMAALSLLRRRPVPAVLFLAGFLVLFAAPLLKPGGGSPGLPATTAGLDALIGFHDGASGLDSRRIDAADWRWLPPSDLLLKLARETGTPHDVRNASGIFRGGAVRWALGHPLPAIELIGRKAFLLIQAYDPPIPESLSFRARETVPWARWLLPFSAVVLGFGLAGLILNREGRTPFLVLAAGVLLAAALGVVRSGDRLTFLLVLLPPAGAALAGLRDRRNLAVGAALSILLAAPWLYLPARYESKADEHYFLGAVYDRLKRPAESMSELDRAVRLDPHHVGARLVLAGALARDGLNDQASKEIRTALEDAPDFTQGWRFLAGMQQNLGQLEAAVESWKELIRLDPGSAEAQNNLGTVYAALGRYDDAMAALEQALVLDPTYREAGINLTEIRKRGPEGLTGARLDTQGPGNAVQRIQAGVAEAMQKLQAGDVAGATAQVNELRGMFGATPDIDFASGNLAIQAGAFDQAIELYERSRTQMSNNPVLLLNLGVAYAQSGRMEKALPLWEEVLRLDPANEVARRNIEAARTGTAAPSSAP